MVCYQSKQTIRISRNCSTSMPTSPVRVMAKSASVSEWVTLKQVRSGWWVADRLGLPLGL
jgi:hypothetical protein